MGRSPPPSPRDILTFEFLGLKVHLELGKCDVFWSVSSSGMDMFVKKIRSGVSTWFWVL